MRYGVISDIHGNLQALRASVADLRGMGVEAWICVGDIVGYGPQPNECVETIAELDALCVAGNHELLAVGSLSGDRSGALCRETTQWTRSVLRKDCQAFVTHLPHQIVEDVLVVAHGSLTDPEQYVRTTMDNDDQLRQLGETRQSARILVLGHTHRQSAYSEVRRSFLTLSQDVLQFDTLDKVLLNPGAVGQSRQRERSPMARHMLIDTGRSEMIFRSIPYDVDGTVRALRRHGLPDHCHHIHPGLRPKIRRRTRRMWRSFVEKRRSSARFS